MSLVGLIYKKESLYIDVCDRRDLVFDKKDLASIDKVAKILGRNKDIKMPNIRHLILKSKFTNSSWSRLRIQSIQSRFKLIKFHNSKKKLASKPVNNENIISYIADILIELDNSVFLLKIIWSIYRQRLYKPAKYQKS